MESRLETIILRVYTLKLEVQLTLHLFIVTYFQALAKTQRISDFLFQFETSLCLVGIMVFVFCLLAETYASVASTTHLDPPLVFF